MIYQMMQAPSLNKFSSDLPIMTIGANGKMDEVEFYDLVDKKLAVVSLSARSSSSNITGGQEREIK
jgi:HAE1 family hydrophobic/amphiphilic exporter-1